MTEFSPQQIDEYRTARYIESIIHRQQQYVVKCKECSPRRRGGKRKDKLAKREKPP